MGWREAALTATRTAALDAWAVLAPVECSGCGSPDRALCERCRVGLEPDPRRTERGGVPVWAGLDYAGVPRRVLAAYKDAGRTDAAAALAEPLAAAVAAALADAPGATGLQLVTIPSSPGAWRTRGYHPVERLLAHAGLRRTIRLAQVRDVADQVGLGRDERGRNKEGSLEARRRLDGVACLIVDDVVTTGATLLEARRAVLEAGGTVPALAVLAETRRRHPVAGTG